ncbi:alpha-L-fucosidase [Metarhizium guizhouense ARSEF 977]|uniref:Alpha-L-fucosidase n=1 Tax=Metarhizium guizhouense (strain ARSEF 977) TaxID=1276136 RepID=A0A0B4HTV0_METGA|nr:alpha-L-fucosidase [Metarhizium guizhouense ARSEF 977]
MNLNAVFSTSWELSQTVDLASMDPNRAWHDPVVEIYSNLITHGVRCSAEAYDLANRRWYCLKVEAEVEDDQWLSSTIATHLGQYYAANREEPPWNTIRMNAEGSLVTFDSQPADKVDRPIRKSLCYGHKRADRLPTTAVDNLKNLTYISRSADRCTWSGQDCVFKRIEFDVDVEVIDGEIQTRETLIHAMGPVPATQINNEMARRFCLVPILAVVVADRKPWKPGTVAGILMPYAGEDLESLVRNSNPGLSLTLTQLLDLVRGVRELSTEQGDGPGKLMLIDAGSEAPEYDGDAGALGTLLLWCLENTPALRQDRQAKAMMVAAASALVNGNFDAALSCLSARK